MYQDHLTKSCVLRPVKSKRPTEAASPILDLCLLLVAPAILQSDNGHELTAHVQSLHWLPIEQRIEYKLSLLCLKIISLQAPIYLSELLHLYTTSRQLRSFTDSRMFRIPSFRTKYCGQRSFSYQAPIIWNQLTVSVRHSTSVSSFKSSSKTFLCKKQQLFFSLIALRCGQCVCVCVCVCVCSSALLCQ